MKKQRCATLILAMVLSLAGSLIIPQPVRAAVVTDVSASELAGMQQLYAVSIPNGVNWGSQASIPYSVDNASSIPSFTFSRAAYYYEVQRLAGHPLGTGPREWVYAEFDISNADQIASQLGVPVAGTGKVENGTLLNNMNVESNFAGITTGTGLTGLMEFWSSNYGPNGGGLYNENTGNYDWKDSGGSSGGGYGSMQIANVEPGSEHMLFAFNRFTGGGAMGIGSQPSGNRDWTFGPNASTYSIKNIEVWVGGVGAGFAAPEPSTVSLLFAGITVLAASRRWNRRDALMTEVDGHRETATTWIREEDDL